MTFLETLLIAIGLSMDAFAVALSKGLSMKKFQLKSSLLIALTFGAFQAVMPIIGYLAGVRFYVYITAVDHWIVFALLLFIGGKMIIDAIRDNGEEKEEEFKLKIGELLVLGISTSIDALAIGISFAFLQTPIWGPAGIIGATTFLLSLAGAIIGNQFGTKFQKAADITGGVILILIGIKVLLEHYGVIAF